MHPIADPRLPDPTFEASWERRLNTDPFPRRAMVLVERRVLNQHGVSFRYRIYTNRTHKRFWFEVLAGEDRLHDYAATSSKRIADGWIAAIQEAISISALRYICGLAKLGGNDHHISVEADLIFGN